MTTRHLDRMFHPTSVALIGASQQPGSVAAVVAQNLFAAGFPGERFLVTPHPATLEGVPTYPDIASLPTAPELAVLVTAPETVPETLAALDQRGTKAAVVLTAGCREGTHDSSRAWRLAMVQAARPHRLRIIGPRGLGIMVPGAKLNASMGHLHPLPGRLAFVAQSGAVVSAVLDWATARRVGFSHLVSLGDMADVEVGDMLDYLAHEPHTRAILLCLEVITQAREFMSAARAAARMKPVVVKVGSADAVYDAAFRRADMLQVHDVQALFDMVQYRQRQELLLETPPAVSDAFTPDTTTARDVVEKALADERCWLAAHEANAVLAAYGIPIVSTQMPQPTVPWPHAQTLRLGMIEDALFGPVLVCGQGGAAAEGCQDTAFALPPLTMLLARDMMARTHIYRLLAGNGETPAVDLEALAVTLLKVSQLVCDLGEITVLDINPLLASTQGVLALAARMQVGRATRPASARLAICPYPTAWQETLTLPDGTTLVLRPIRPEDEPAYQALFQQLSLDDIRYRFFRPMTLLSHALAASLTQIDYDREMALVLTSTTDSGAAELYGEVRLSAEPSQERAEFALLLRPDMTGKGLGPLLLRASSMTPGRRALARCTARCCVTTAPCSGSVRPLGLPSRPYPATRASSG